MEAGGRDISLTGEEAFRVCACFWALLLRQGARSLFEDKHAGEEIKEGERVVTMKTVLML